jgi:CBS domain-containing protein
MKRHVHASCYAHGRPELVRRLFVDEHVPLLLHATDTQPSAQQADGSVSINVRTTVLSHQLAKRIRVRAGAIRDVDTRTHLPVSWEAESARMAFPRFDGAITVEAVSSFAALVSLDGSYDPPLGPVGAAMDDIVLHDLAQDTAQWLVRSLAHELAKTVAPAPIAPSHTDPDDRGVRSPMRVRDVMTTDVRVIDSSSGLRAAAAMLFTGHISGAPVVDDDGELIGVLSERDILATQAPRAHGFGRRAAGQRRRHDAHTAADACSSPALVIAPDTAVREAAATMLDRDISRLVVVAQGRIVGIITHHDVLAALLVADDQVTAAVERLLLDEGASDVAVSVSDGTVALTGAVRLRSTASALPRLVNALDGVAAVETKLRWRIDDLTRPQRTSLG